MRKENFSTEAGLENETKKETAEIRMINFMRKLLQIIEKSNQGSERNNDNLSNKEVSERIELMYRSGKDKNGKVIRVILNKLLDNRIDNLLSFQILDNEKSIQLKISEDEESVLSNIVIPAGALEMVVDMGDDKQETAYIYWDESEDRLILERPKPTERETMDASPLKSVSDYDYMQTRHTTQSSLGVSSTPLNSDNRTDTGGSRPNYK